MGQPGRYKFLVEEYGSKMRVRIGARDEAAARASLEKKGLVVLELVEVLQEPIIDEADEAESGDSDNGGKRPYTLWRFIGHMILLCVIVVVLGGLTYALDTIGLVKSGFKGWFDTNLLPHIESVIASLDSGGGESGGGESTTTTTAEPETSTEAPTTPEPESTPPGDTSQDIDPSSSR